MQKVLDMATVAFIGLGVMGYPMAGHLKTRGGHDVCVYNRTAAKAEKWASEFDGSFAPTPDAAAEDADKDTAAGAVGGALGFWLGFDFLKDALLGQSAVYAFPALTPTGLDTSAFREVGDFARGSSAAAPAEELLGLSLVMPGIGAVVLIVIALLILHRRAL